jgi:hypothetical protein
VAELLLFHHAQGQTPGFLAFADALRAAGHRVDAPDLYDGRTFADLDGGVAHAKQVGFDTVITTADGYNTLTLKFVLLGTLTSRDFIFG